MDNNNEKEEDANDKSNVDNSDDEKDRQMLLSFISESEERIMSKRKQREENNKSNIKYPDESFFVRLDSSIKKNSAFVKKLKNMTDQQKESILKDMNSLNLTRYISEVVSAIVEAKLKMNDIPMAIKFCTTLHQRYPDFSMQLLDVWSKSFPRKPGDQIISSKLRVDIRLFSELISSGILPTKESLLVLGNLLMLLTDKDKETHNNLNIIVSFCRHCGDDFCGLVPRKMRMLSEKMEIVICQSDFLPSEKQKAVKSLLKEYYQSLCSHVISDHKSLKNQEKQIRKALQMRGEVSKERKEKFENSQLEWQKLWKSTQELADLIDENLPELCHDILELDENEDSIVNFDVSNRFKGQPDFEPGSLWEDEDTRTFYQQLPDLKALIPSILYKDSVKEDEKTADTEKTKEEESKILPSESEEVEDEETMEVIEELEVEAVTAVSEVEETELSDEEANKEVSKASNKILLDAFLNTLVNCVNRDMIDKAAINFCTNLNTKNNRKKLARTLFSVPRTRLDLLPFYARFVAQVTPVMPQVATDLVAMLKQDFRFLFKKKDQINIESKVKNVRFIGELVKFEIFSKNDALQCLKLLLLDFKHHHIEMTCNLLETCGRFLFRSPDSHLRAKYLLDQMMRKKALLPFDSRYITMIENAYYFANPPESQAISRVERPPLQEYIRKQLYHVLNKMNVEKVLRQIRKLNWDDPEIALYTIKCLTAVWNVKYYNVRCLANLLAGLNTFQEWVPPRIIDGVLEDIRLGMEMNQPKFNQRRVAVIRYLGELYNYRLVESSIIFKVLYSLITYGIVYDHNVYSELDPPDNLIRIRLICNLLEICGPYFSAGVTKKKLDYFLYFFQKYFWFKKSHEIYNEDNQFPFSINHLFKEVVLLFRPKFKLADSYENAVKSLENLLTELKQKVQEILPNVCLSAGAKDPSVSEDESLGLKPIAEVDEDYEMDSEVHEVSHHETGSDDEYEGNFDQNLEFQPKGITTSEGSDLEANPDLDYCEPRKRVVQTVQCAEDDEFQKDFDKLMSESLIARSQDVVRTNTDIVVPTNRDTAKKTVAFSDGGTIEKECDTPLTINFMVMTRAKGNKPVLKNVDVPIDSELAKSLKIREEAERAEKEAVKRLVLDINERREMEDRDLEMERGTNSGSNLINLNRDHKRRYQHPKGVPDIDVVFGNKKR